jgi:hypothetical protein
LPAPENGLRPICGPSAVSAVMFSSSISSSVVEPT